MRNSEFWLGILRGVLLACLIWASVEGALLLRQIRSDTAASLRHISTLTHTLQSELTPADLKNLKNAINTTAYTSQSVANDYGTVAKATVKLLDNVTVNSNRVVNRTESLLARVEEKTLPSVEVAVDRVSGRLVILLDSTDQTVQVLKDRLSDPALSQLLEATTETVRESKLVAIEAEGTLRDLRLATSELAIHLSRLSGQATDTTRELEIFLAELNKPRSRKSKLWRAIIQAVALGLPIYLQVR